MNIEGKENNKILYIELLRIIAVFFVIFNHTGNKGFFLFSKYDPSSVWYWIFLFLSIFDKFAVPVFLAVSGALLLGKPQESVSYLFKNRILKKALTLVFFSFFYYCVRLYYSHEIFSLNNFIVVLFTSNWNFSFWFIYIYIAMLATLPFLRQIVKNLQNEYFHYMIGITVFFSGLALFSYIFGIKVINSNFIPYWLMSNILIYPCIGYFLHYRIEQISVKLLSVVWFVNIVTIAISCYATYYRIVVTGICLEAESQQFHNSFVIINLITIFLTVKFFTERINFSNYEINFVRYIGSCTFGIYLFHVLFLYNIKFLYKFWNKLTDVYHFDQMIATLIYCVIVMFFSFLTTAMMKKVPYVRKLV